ncbi:hypothetical protein ACXYN8_04750 [Altererythrobacter sp. CAU 1778]
MRRNFTFALASLLALSACDRSDPPSDSIKNAMDTAVEEVAGTAPAKMAEGPFAPQDGCADLEGAAEFRNRLAQAVEARDTAALLALTSDDVRLDFGGGSGHATLSERLGDSEYGLWKELEAILPLGCALAEGGGIVMPSYFAKTLGSRDATMSMIVTGERVPLHKAATANSEVLQSISWDAVELDGGLRPDQEFQKVRLIDGTEGFIETAMLRSYLAHRLLASSRDGIWAITAFVAGD